MSRTEQRDGAGLNLAAEGLLAAYASMGRFSGVALVARAGKVLASVALGLADRGTGRPLTIDTRFALGSLSKQFTAAAVLDCAAAGTLAVGDPIARHVGDLGLAYGEVVTIEHLLDHTSGIPSLFKPHFGIELDDARAERPASRAELVERFRDLPLRFAPGSRVEYSNSGYALLALIVERVSGLEWADYLEQRVLGPAGLTRTSTRSEPSDAIGYLGSKRGSAAHPSWLLGSGDLVGPAVDLARWDCSPAAAGLHARLATRGPAPGYAFGLAIGERQGRRVVHHDGGLAGFVTTYQHLPEHELCVVVLTNAVPDWSHVPLCTRTAQRIADQLADLALGLAPRGAPAPLPSPGPAELARFVGGYALPDGLVLEVVRRGDRLWVQTGGARPWTLWGLDELAGLDARPRAQRAAALVAALAQARFADALALFAPANARALTPEALAQLWQTICRHAGGVPNFRVLQLRDDLAYLRAPPRLDGVVAFDDEDRVVGFHLVPFGTGPASPAVELALEGPARGQHHFAPARFRANGYRFAVDDVELSFEPDESGEHAVALDVHLGGGFRAVRLG